VSEFLLWLDRWLRRLSTLALWISGAGLVLMTVIIAWQVFARFVLNDSPSWTETSSILLMGWFIFLGAAVGVRERTHLGFDVLLYFMPAGAKQIFRTISDVVVLAFGVGMIIYGCKLSALTWDTVMPALKWHGGLAFFSVIGGGILVCLFTLERMVGRLAGLPVDESPAETVDHMIEAEGSGHDTDPSSRRPAVGA
jgi:TRAP-type C4-dicarboxylate transport system permease small subunit